MTRACRWQLVDINKETFIRITRIVRQQAMVDKLLSAVTLVAWGKGTTGGLWVLAGLEASCLSVVVNIVYNYPPFSLNITGTLGH